jgi:hypothetical protein
VTDSAEKSGEEELRVVQTDGTAGAAMVEQLQSQEGKESQEKIERERRSSGHLR